jgi:hypothetical protein
MIFCRNRLPVRPKFAAFPIKNGIPATLAKASRLVAAVFRFALKAELAAAA